MSGLRTMRGMNNITSPSNPEHFPTVVVNAGRHLFNLGQGMATPSALLALGTSGIAVLLSRHVNGDWGDLPLEDHLANMDALVWGNRILSRYNTTMGAFYVITEADRSYTTVMHVSEY